MFHSKKGPNSDSATLNGTQPLLVLPLAPAFTILFQRDCHENVLEHTSISRLLWMQRLFDWWCVVMITCVWVKTDKRNSSSWAGSSYKLISEVCSRCSGAMYSVIYCWLHPSVARNRKNWASERRENKLSPQMLTIKYINHRRCSRFSRLFSGLSGKHDIWGACLKVLN